MSEAANWEHTAKAAVAHLEQAHDLLHRWLVEGAAMGGGPRSRLTRDTLEALGVVDADGVYAGTNWGSSVECQRCGARTPAGSELGHVCAVAPEKAGNELERVAADLAWWWRQTQSESLDDPRNEMSWWVQPARVAIKATTP